MKAYTANGQVLDPWERNILGMGAKANMLGSLNPNFDSPIFPPVESAMPDPELLIQDLL